MVANVLCNDRGAVHEQAGWLRGYNRIPEGFLCVIGYMNKTVHLIEFPCWIWGSNRTLGYSTKITSMLCAIEERVPVLSSRGHYG